MSLQHLMIVTALIATALPVAAAVLRGRSRRMVTATTLFTAVAAAVYLLAVLRLLGLAPQYTPGGWVYVLVGSPVFLLLGGYLLTLSFGRDHPVESLSDSRRTLGALVLLGGAFLALLHHKAFVTGYEWYDERGTIHFGHIGKAYCGYLLVGIVLVGHNLEKTYRVSSAESRVRIRTAVVGIFAALGYLTFVLATGLLYSSIGMGRLVASALPIACAAVLIAHGYVRGAISDAAAPVSRSFVYTSFTALAAGLFVLAIAIAAQVATFTSWSPDEILIFAVGFLAVMITALLAFSNRFQRRVRRFIDLNFYTNRYDYRSQWSRLTETLEQAADQEMVLDRAAHYLEDVFHPEALTIAVRDEATHDLYPARGRGVGAAGVHLRAGSPLHARLAGERRSLILERNPHDFTYIPVYAENKSWLDATACQLIAPLADGKSLLGTLGLQRSANADRFTFEDAKLLDSVCAHVTATLRGLRLARELAESRETELVSQWSSMILHDLKNYIAPLRMAATNLGEAGGDGEVVSVCSEDICRVADRMEERVRLLGELRAATRLEMDVQCPNQIVREALRDLQAAQRPGLEIVQQLEAEGSIRADRTMLRRVVENLITNAVEAMDGRGRLLLVTRDDRMGESHRVQIAVADTGPGIQEEFLRDRLFRPFSTTKKKGLGMGLWQCRMIVQAHGGEISVASRPGQGATFHIVLDGHTVEPQVNAMPQPVKISAGGVANELSGS